MIAYAPLARSGYAPAIPFDDHPVAPLPFIDQLLANYRPAMRPAIEQSIEALIAFLDALDGDADDGTENGDERDAILMEECEPSLGWTDFEAATRRYALNEGDLEDDPSEGEPSLGGALGDGISQLCWALGGDDDREDEDEHGTDEHGGQEYGPGRRRAA